MIKKILITIIVVIVLYCFYSPIVIKLKEENATKSSLVKDEVFSLKKLFKEDHKNYKAYIILIDDDFEDLSPKIKKAKVLISTDQIVIDELLTCKFKYTDSDVATVDSRIYIYDDGKLLFESGIVLDKNSQGLQNQEMGWVKPINENQFIAVCSKFKRYNFPLLILK